MSAVMPYQPDFTARMGMQPNAVSNPIGNPTASQPAGRQTLRQLLANQGITEDDWTRANSMEGGGNLQDRQKVWDAYLKATGGTGYGSKGAYNYYSNPAQGGGGDNGGSGGPSEGFGTDANSFFGADAFGKGYSPVMYGTENGFLGDRGNYNYAIPDLGALEFDPQYGLVNNQSRIPGSRTSTSFDHFNTLTKGVIGSIAGAGLANAAGIQGIPGFDQGSTGVGTGAGTGGLGVNGLDPLALDTTSAGAITPSGPFAGAGTGFTGTAAAPAIAGAGTGAVPSVGNIANTAISNVAAGTPIAGAAGTAGSGGLTLTDVLNGGRTGLGLANTVGAIRGITGNGVGTQQGAQQAGRDAAAAADPFANQRGFYQDWLKQNFPNLVSNDPAQIMKDPAYQFQLDQGVKAIDRSAAAGGMFNSGNRPLELEKFGQGLASDFTQKQFARNNATLSQLLGLTGATSGNPGAAGNALLSGFTGATNLQGNYLNQLLGTSGTGGSIFDVIGNTANGVGNFWNWLNT